MPSIHRQENIAAAGDRHCSSTLGSPVRLRAKVLLTLLRLLDAGIRPAAIVVEVLPLWPGADSPPEEQFRADR